MEELIGLVKKYALKLAPPGEPFRLKGGGTSDDYLDVRQLTLRPAGLHAVVRALGRVMATAAPVDAVGGPSVGADPIVGGLVFCGRCRGFLVRPEAKGHGLAGRVVGPVGAGDRCVVVEDVTTTGRSAVDAVECVRALGAQVVAAYSVVDRLAGAAELFASRGVPYVPLLTVRDLGLGG